MAFVFELPEIGEGVVEGEVVEWKVAVGDSIAEDQPLCDIMTDKATVEISSPKSGVVTALHGEPGDIIQVHTPLADIDVTGAAPKPKPKSAAKTPAAPVAAPVADKGRTIASPSVRRGAREAGIDVNGVTGTGAGGRVTRDDVARASGSAPVAPVVPVAAPVAVAPVVPVAAVAPVVPVAPVAPVASPAPVAAVAPTPAPIPVAPPALPQVRPSGSEERVRIIGLRRKIAEQMVMAKRTAPHFTYVEEFDATNLVGTRSRLKKVAADRGVKLTYMAFVIKACSIAFRDFPNVNAVMDEAKFELVVKGDHNIGIACDTPQGLFVPVIKNVEQKSILHIAAELTDLVARTRAGKASASELTGGTFTITSVGTIGGVLATPILNVPQVAILGFNVIRPRAVVVDGEIVVREMSYLSPSFDHRVLDGAVAARFVARLVEILNDPESMLLEMA